MILTKTIYQLIFFTVSMCLSSLSNAQANFPEELALEYEFKLASIPLGSVEKRVKCKDGICFADSVAKPSIQAKLFYKGEVRETSSFKIENNKLIPLSFHATRHNYKPYDRKADFDHTSKTVNYNDGRSEKLRDNSFDLGSFPFAFAFEDLSAINNKTFEINTGHKYSSYVALKPSDETIETPAGKFDTTKITLKRIDKENRFYYVWLAKDTNYPVQIISDKKGKKSSLLLKSFKN